MLQQRSVEEAASGSRQDFPFVIASTPPGAGQRKLIFVAIAMLVLGIAIMLPFAAVPGPRIDAFIPVLQTVMCVADLITAILLFAQYSIQPQRALLALAAGYICSGTFAFLQTLAFPGAYTPTGLFGSTDHAPWFFVLWHITFQVAIIVYAALKDRPERTIAPSASTGPAIAITVACVLSIAVSLTLAVIGGATYLPLLYAGDITQQTLAARLVNVLIWLTGSAAIVVLLVRKRSILDYWLIVTLVAWMPNFVVAFLVTSVRFSLGWYVARGYALLASFALLAVLLTETTFLYARLVAAVTLLRRERANRLMSVDAATAALAHEIRQPLSGITARSGAAKRWLDRTPPDIEKVRECLTGIAETAHRANDIISGVRGLVRKISDERAALSINELAQQAVAPMERDLQVNEVLVTTEYSDGLPEILGNRTLLQQVLLNLVRNAVEAMSSLDRRNRRLRLVTKLKGKSTVLLSVEDGGPGISLEDQPRIFDPFFTTKPAGTGLGLSICRTIIDEHGGELRLAKTGADGSVFEIVLPVASA